MVIEYKKGEQQYDELLKTITPTVVSFDVQQATLARIAWGERMEKESIQQN